MNEQDVVRQNAAMRGALLATAPRARKNLGTFSGYAAGGTARIKLFNTGITTRVRYRVHTALDLGAGAGVASPQAPFNIVSNAQLQDFDGTARVNVPGYGLWLVNCVRNKTLWGFHNFAGGSAASPEPVVPTTAATANQTFAAWNEIPLAYNVEDDLRGAMLTQTGLGEVYLNLTFNNTLFQAANADALYNGGTASVNVNAAQSLKVDVFQDFLIMQQIGGQVPMPQMDLLTVYELASLRSSDNIAVGQEKLVSLPNARALYAAYMWYVNNGVMTAVTTALGDSITNDMSLFRLYANGNNILTENTMLSQLFEQRQSMLADGDLRASTYFMDWRLKPLETAVLGNLQIGLTPSAYTAGNTYFGLVYESMYTKGSVLPGLQQAG